MSRKHMPVYVHVYTVDVDSQMWSYVAFLYRKHVCVHFKSEHPMHLQDTCTCIVIASPRCLHCTGAIGQALLCSFLLCPACEHSSLKWRMPTTLFTALLLRKRRRERYSTSFPKRRHWQLSNPAPSMRKVLFKSYMYM